MVGKNLPACTCWAVILGAVIPFTQQTQVVLELPEQVVDLSARTVERTKLTSRPIRCTDGARVFMGSVSPASPCGACFAVWPEGKGYALYFLPGQGQLSYTVASSYTVSVQCTDGITSTSRPVEVRVLDSNSPPIFVTPAPGVVSEEVDVKLPSATTAVLIEDQFRYQVQTADTDNDTILYEMDTEDPADSDFFEIGYVDGIVRAKKDMRFFCQSSVRFSITAFEAGDRNVKIGPREIRLELKNGNTKPTIVGSATEVTVEEQPEGSTGLRLLPIELEVDDDTTFLPNHKISWRMRAEPEEGLQYYTLVANNQKAEIKAEQSKLNYEYKPLRSVTLYVDASDGFCEAKTYTFTVNITDINELPTVFPFGNTKDRIYIEGFVYEGHISFLPNISVTDPDEGDTLTWSLKTSTRQEFVVDPSTGIIHSTEPFHVDNEEKSVRELKLTVTDKGGLQKDIFVKLTIRNKNEHLPEFKQVKFQPPATEWPKLDRLFMTFYIEDLDNTPKYKGVVFNGTGVDNLLKDD
ncbi:cadherin-17-like [Littorina saxatilis]|uniref:cadherin-17-like n=1 Tax=Littorina saxatilis TaxID=31220 RepID=UPI0038B62302